MDHSHDHAHSHDDGHDHGHELYLEHSHAHPVKAEFIGGDGKMYHSHDGLAPHTHEPLESPGFFSRRAQPLTTRDYTERAFTVGIGGPVGTGYVCTDQAFIYTTSWGVLAYTRRSFNPCPALRHFRHHPTPHPKLRPLRPPGTSNLRKHLPGGLPWDLGVCDSRNSPILISQG